MDPQAQQQVVTQPPTSDAFVDPTQRKPGFSPKALFKNKLTLLGVLLIVILVVIGGLWFLNTQKQGDYEKALKNAQEAQSAYEKGDLATVQEKLLASYKVSPKDPKTQAALIKAIAVEGNLTGKEQEAFKKAEPYVNEALATNRNSTDVLLAVGYVNEIAGKYSEALAFYEEALGIDANNAEGLFHKGHVLEFLGRQQEAFVEYEKAYQLDKNNSQIVTSYAKAVLSQGKTEDAFNLYMRAASLLGISSIDKAEALTNASIIKRGKLLNITEALTLSQQATEADNQYSPAFGAHGYNLGLNGDPEEGIKYLKKAIELNPRISNNYWQLGLVTRAIKQYGEAIAYLEAGIDRVDNDNTLLGNEQRNKAKAFMIYNLAQTKYWNGNKTEVLGLINQSINLDPFMKTKLKEDYEDFNMYGDILTQEQVNQLTQ